MSLDALISAMRAGSTNPLEKRNPNDLGRFGLGLKTASFSQCRRLTVASVAKGTPVSVRRWDLDYIGETSQWRLLYGPAVGSEDRLAKLENTASGTLVLWERMDRLVGETTVTDTGLSGASTISPTKP